MYKNQFLVFNYGIRFFFHEMPQDAMEGATKCSLLCLLTNELIGSSQFVYNFSSVNLNVCTIKPLDSEKPDVNELFLLTNSLIGTSK